MMSVPFKLCGHRLLLFAMTLSVASPSVAADTDDQTTLITAARLFDGTSGEVITPGAVLVAGERIVATGADARDAVADVHTALGDVTILPGLIDAHTHLSYLWQDTTSAPDFLSDYLGSPILVAFAAARNAERTLHVGFTTVREMGSTDGIDLALAAGVEHGLIDGPRILTAGPLYPPGGGRGDMTWPPDGTVRSREEIVARTREYIGQGCDWIKIYATSGTYDDTTGVPFFTEDEMAAAVEVAHAQHRWVAAHVMGLDGARRAVRAGVRSLEHGSRLDVDVVAEMARRGTFLIPTLFHLEWYTRHGHELAYATGFEERLAALQSIQFASVRLARDAGVRIVAGSDAVYSMHGENAGEIVWLVNAGLTPVEALRAATSTAAALLGLEERIGRIAPGFDADIIAVRGDPTQHIADVQRVAFVMTRGRIARHDAAR